MYRHLLSLHGSFNQIYITSQQNERLPQLIYYLRNFCSPLQVSKIAQMYTNNPVTWLFLKLLCHLIRFAEDYEYWLDKRGLAETYLFSNYCCTFHSCTKVITSCSLIPFPFYWKIRKIFLSVIIVIPELYYSGKCKFFLHVIISLFHSLWTILAGLNGIAVLLISVEIPFLCVCLCKC